MIQKFIQSLSVACAVAIFGCVGSAFGDDSAKPGQSSDGSPSGGASTEKKSSLANRSITGRATRVAFLDFGPPPEWKDRVGNMVGTVISVKAFRETIPMLEADKVDVVVVRINSGGGMLNEMEPFQMLFQNEFETKFRTVAWVHHAISAAAMSPWVLDEFYMEPEGHIGGCTGFNGATGIAIGGMQLLDILEKMRKVSIMGGRDPKIMRSMQIQEPLSANIDEMGNVQFFQDATSGSIVVNPVNQVLTLNAIEATRIKFSRGIADTVPDLMKVMGINEYEVVGQKATNHLQKFMERVHLIEKRVGELSMKFRLSRDAALSLRGEQNREARGVEVGKCRQALNQIRSEIRLNPNLAFMLAGGFQTNELDKEWFDEQERMLKQLMQDR